MIQNNRYIEWCFPHVSFKYCQQYANVPCRSSWICKFSISKTIYNRTTEKIGLVKKVAFVEEKTRRSNFNPHSHKV